ncbi:hypothetical protein M422DRAFT_273137 [Sphaerobolus stellatus SS14]|uniref:Unplaced genomic scaffold SPHSTscaffold_320, whole genome shotgun sequence n=1 Tax=Sphaerobolus stellatus (strain SS14) TaxID=990650 RepID=A0A0C9T9X1_SPHS4|nr:hypothetical protein M422DRAFT_273137 [Sphaerobolus stellatus SS14]
MSWSPKRGWNGSQMIASNWSSSLKAVSDAAGDWKIFGLDINNNVRHIAFRQGEILEEETFKCRPILLKPSSPAMEGPICLLDRLIGKYSIVSMLAMKAGDPGRT